MFVAKFIEVKSNGEEVIRKRKFDNVDKARMWLLSVSAELFSPWLELFHYENGFVEVREKPSGKTKFGISLYSDIIHEYVTIL